MLAVVNAEYQEGYRLWIEFDDGESGIVDLEQDLWGPVFEPLRDRTRFQRFRLSETFHTLVWESGADFAPEHLRRRLLEQAPERLETVATP